MEGDRNRIMKQTRLEKKISKCKVEIWWAEKMIESPILSYDKLKYLKQLKKWEKKLNKLKEAEND